MPLFFREEKKRSPKNVQTNLEIDDVLELVPTCKDLEIKSLSNPDLEQTSVSNLLDEGSTNSPEIVPSRKSKPLNRLLAGSMVLLMAPMVVLFFRMVTDSFTRDFVSARILWVMKDNTGAIQYFSKALKETQDLRALEARADCYETIGDLKNERGDLRLLVQSKDLNKMPKQWQVYRLYSKLATLEARLGDIGNAKKLYELYATFPADQADRSSYSAKESAYELLLLDDISKSKAVLAKVINPKVDLLSNTIGVSDFSRQVLQALYYREEGDEARAMETVQSIGDKYVWAFRDSRFRYNSKNEVVRWSLEALLYLDDRNIGKARPLIQQAEKEMNGRDKSRPIIDVLKAWLLLEEGRLDDCLNLTQATLASQKELDSSISGLNLKAALHLIRKNVFVKQKLAKQAEYEDALYKETNVSGRIFTPLWAR